MGGKKKGPAKKGKGGDDEVDVGLMNTIMKAQVESLKQRLVLEYEKANKSAAKEEDMRQDQVSLEQEMGEHKEVTRTMVGNMTKLYR